MRKKSPKIWLTAAFFTACAMMAAPFSLEMQAEENLTKTVETAAQPADETTRSQAAAIDKEDAAVQPEDAATQAADATSQVADASQMAAPVELDLEGLVPVTAEQLKDGVYDISVDCSSSMFKIVSCTLTVENQTMTACMVMSGTSYLYIYPGSGEEAAAADSKDYIPYSETAEGVHSFTIPVTALNQPVPCAAFSKNKELWYDRTLVFRADSLDLSAFAEQPYVTAQEMGLADGYYSAEVTLEGGSGRASVQSPAPVRIENGQIYATIIWSSSNYDYMKVDGVQYDRINSEGNSTFEIPAAGFDFALPVVADTVAMGTPHEISYTLTFDSGSLSPSSTGKEEDPAKNIEEDDFDNNIEKEALDENIEAEMYEAEADVVWDKTAEAGSDEPAGTEADTVTTAENDESAGTKADTVTTAENDESAGTEADTVTTAENDESAGTATAENDEPTDTAADMMTEAGSDLDDQAGEFTTGAENTMPLTYATQFSVIYEENGISRITIGGTDTYLLIPEGVNAPEQANQEAIILQQPLDTVYLAASSAMDYYAALEKLDQVRLTSTRQSDWSIEEVRSRMDSGDLLYAGKYSAPDYEQILSQNVDLAIESTMIYHSPQTMEQLQTLGIPVLIERSSYEPDPLGRMEWIKLYGLLAGKEKEAEAFFEQEARLLKEAVSAEPTTPSDGTEPVAPSSTAATTAAFFYISGGGYAVVRQSGDYISKMINMAGGTYVPEDPEPADSSRSTRNMEMERFYEAARDADVIFYNSTIDGIIHSVDELLAKAPQLENFRAVQKGNVWCTEKNLFQQATRTAQIILEMRDILQGQTEGREFFFFHPVKRGDGSSVSP